jgi:hypothetical protein
MALIYLHMKFDTYEANSLFVITIKLKDEYKFMFYKKKYL